MPVDAYQSESLPDRLHFSCRLWNLEAVQQGVLPASTSPMETGMFISICALSTGKQGLCEPSDMSETDEPS